MEPMKVEMQKVGGAYQLNDLFVFTGLRCNLSCSHCYVSSSPKNRTLDELTVGDAVPFLKEAQGFGVKEIYFTGGEPFLNKDAVSLVAEALTVAPVTVYTNGTQPLERSLSEVASVARDSPNRLLLRVSVDHYNAELHDVLYNRGEGNFERAVETVKSAYEQGLPVAVTAQEDVHFGGSDAFVEQEFRRLFKARGVALHDVKVLPAIPQGQYATRHGSPSNGPVTEAEFSNSATMLSNLMCRTSRTLLKYDGAVHVFPCTILVPDRKEVIDDFAQYDMGASLRESFEKQQPLNHPSCRAYCVKGRMTCANQ